MSPRSPALRFDPPPLRPGPALRWVLVRAFAPPDAPAPFLSDAGAGADPLPDAIALARDLDLLARIACRVPRTRLAAEAGDAAVAEARRQRHLAAASALRVLRTAFRVARVAASADIPVAFLKGAALHLCALAPIAARPASDVDVLAPADRAVALARALAAAGFEPRGETRSEHHLAPVGEGDDPPVEVHRSIPGLLVPPASADPGAPAPSGPARATSADAGAPAFVPATFDTLRDAGLLLPAPGLPGNAFVPVPAVLAAHALVHGIDEHGFGADRYPLFRLACDLADVLGPAGDPATAPAAVARLVGTAVAPVEAAAALSLVRRLRAGDPPFDATPEAVLLAHLVAGSRDADYRDALRLRQVFFLLRHRPRGMLRDKLRHRLGGLAPAPGPARALRAAALLARLVRADLRVRRGRSRRA